MKLILLRSCRAGAHFSVRGKVGKRRKGGGVSTPPLLTPPPQRPKGVPPLEFSASPRIALLWGFFNAFLFCIRLLFIQCFSKRPRKTNGKFSPAFFKRRTKTFRWLSGFACFFAAGHFNTGNFYEIQKIGTSETRSDVSPGTKKDAAYNL